LPKKQGTVTNETLTNTAS